jgi:hypothetical protein
MPRLRAAAAERNRHEKREDGGEDVAERFQGIIGCNESARLAQPPRQTVFGVAVR